MAGNVNGTKRGSRTGPSPTASCRLRRRRQPGGPSLRRPRRRPDRRFAIRLCDSSAPSIGKLSPKTGRGTQGIPDPPSTGRRVASKSSCPFSPATRSSGILARPSLWAAPRMAPAGCAPDVELDDRSATSPQESHQQPSGTIDDQRCSRWSGGLSTRRSAQKSSVRRVPLQRLSWAGLRGSARPPRAISSLRLVRVEQAPPMRPTRGEGPEPGSARQPGRCGLRIGVRRCARRC